jgi:hypothetical protein
LPLLLLLLRSVGPGSAAVSGAGSTPGSLPATASFDSSAAGAQRKKPLRGAGAWLHSKLANSRWAQRLLLGATLLMTSMVLADGVLTPSISGVLPETAVLQSDHAGLLMSLLLVAVLLLLHRQGCRDTNDVPYSTCCRLSSTG